MWVFLKKNFWMWQPRRGANPYLLVVALLTSCVDAQFPFPSELWLVICGLAVVLAQAAAAASMNDFKEDSSHFLEYLPIRWSHVWFSSWLDNLLSCALVVPLLMWCRVITWTPPIPGSAQASDPLFATRWEGPVGLFCFVYFTFNYALIGRSVFKSAKASLLLMLGGQTIFFLGAGIMIIFAMALPGARDLWPLLAVEGTIFALCSYVILVLPPRHWSGLRRFMLVGLPAFTLSVVFFFVILHLECQHWKQLDWTEPTLSINTTIARSDHPQIVARVESERSMIHNVVCDPETGRTQFVGRNLQHLYSQSTWNDDRSTTFEGFVSPIDWWPLPAPVITIKGADHPAATLLPDATLDDGSGRRCKVTSVDALPDGRYVVACRSDDGKAGLVRVLGSNARIEDQFAISSGANLLISKSGRLVAITSTSSSPPDYSQEYLMYDLATKQQEKFKLPGYAICFSSDLTQCACLVETSHGQFKDRQVELDSIPTGLTRVIIPVGILPPVPVQSSPTLNVLSWQLPLSGASEFDDTAIMFDSTFTKAVFLLTRFDNGIQHHSLIYENLSTTERHTLVSEPDMIAISPFRMHSLLNLIGFTPDGNAFIYQEASTINKISIPTDLNAPVARSRIEVPLGVNQIEYSPLGTTVLLATQSWRPDYGSVRQTQLRPFNRPGLQVNLPRDAVFQFLDDQRLISTTSNRVSVTDLQGHVQRVLLPPSD